VGPELPVRLGQRVVLWQLGRHWILDITALANIVGIPLLGYAALAADKRAAEQQPNDDEDDESENA
jgi:hypothetical protein